MKIPKRFALSTLLLVMLLVSLVFGYAQWRRQWLKAEVESLVSEIDPVLKENRPFTQPIQFYDDWFWPTVSADVGVGIRLVDDGEYAAKGRTLTTAEAKEYLKAKADRLRVIGVKRVMFVLLVPERRGVRTILLDSPDELDTD